MKWFVRILATILILGAIGLGVWYFFGDRIPTWFGGSATPTATPGGVAKPEEPTDYQPYENTAYKYKVFIPHGWAPSGDTNAASVTAKLLADANNPTGLRVEITIDNNSDRLRIDDFIKRYNQARGIQPTTEEAVEVGGITATKQMTDLPSPMTLIHFRKGTQIYSIVFTGPTDQYDQNIGVFSKIYHSFGFN